MFEFYVLRYNMTKKKVEMFNIFNNWVLEEAVVKEVEEYMRDADNYTYTLSFGDEKTYRGWEAFKTKVLKLIQWQEWSRIQYEISVGQPFEDNTENLEKWDCYSQCVPNIEIICYTILRQYKSYNKI